MQRNFAEAVLNTCFFVFMQMFEGHDTTSAAVSWCLFLLGENPKVQERAFQEIDAVMGGDRTRPPTMKELGEMRYLECCIKEALRLYPSVPLIARKLKEDIKIGDYNSFASN